MTAETMPYPATDYQEANRGQYHFSTRGGWMNDPNGLLHYRGTYHLYYQHAPNSLVWDTMHWGHATSTDLVRWEQQPIALNPEQHVGELWSGGGVVDVRNTSGLKDGDHDPILVFTGTQGVRTFYSLDGGFTFTAYDEGRVIAQPSGRESRDPKVVWHPPTERWVMVVWSDNDGNGLDFFVSADLLSWERTSRITAGWAFECPDFTLMPLDGDLTDLHWVLRDGRGSYLVGDFDGREFHTDWTEPQTITRNPGPAASDYYAAQSFDNLPDGRVVTVAWQGKNSGSVWTGNLSLAVEQRLVSTPEGPRLASEPVDELRTLRHSSSTWQPGRLTPEEACALLAGEAAETYELAATIDLGATEAGSITFRLRVVADGTSGRDVTYDVAAVTLDGHSLPTAPNGVLTVRLLVDRGQLEIFAQDGLFYECLNVDFDSGSGGDGIELVADGPVVLTDLAVHRLGSIWT
ncbi:levanase/fructan beta-fructosidase [Kribbella amoyensis]|uniref:Levanase/fructan beta-fructosidase n=1 Tax=Kribbella amoyensis TaxID=996641 RepID=A0A561BL99_9ACTN|nr:glycoside hydrolase family 32 protein [Kribbella amoyensis]TWD79607.1 levanase/fructan beta-fructosidase [Kribbella amoyensis]